MDGGFLIQITAKQTTFFMTAGGSVVPLDISGRMTGLVVIRYSDPLIGYTDPSPGIAAMFNVELGVGVPSTDTSSSRRQQHLRASSPSRAASASRSTRRSSAQTFTVPQAFLSVLPQGFPGTLTICGHTPEIDGTCAATGTPAAYIQAIVSGEITLGNVLTLTGTIGFEAAVGANGTAFIRIFGAVSTNIQYLGSLSGSLDLGFYTAAPTDPPGTFDPGIIGRVSLALDSSAIPGVSLSGHFVLEVNLFLNSSANVQTVTFLTNSEACSLHASNSAIACDSSAPANQLAIDPTTHLIETGLVTIDQGLRLELQGTLTIASLVDVNGSFVFSFSKDPFAIEIVAHASIALHGFGTMGAGGSLTGIFLLDGNGLSLYMSIGAGAMGNFGSGVGLGFSASATVSFSTVGYTRNIDSSTGKTCATGAANCVSIQSGFLLAINGSVDFIGIASATGSVTIAISANQFTIDFNVDLSIGPLDLMASGFAGVYTASGHAGLVLQLDVAINFDLFSIIKIKGNGQIRLNTTPDDHTVNGITIGHNSFLLHIDGSVSLLDVIKLQTSVDLIVGGGVAVTAGSGDTYVSETVGDGQWFFKFTGDANFFGIATLHASGWVDSHAHFGVDLNGGITIGSSSFGLSGNFDVHAWLSQAECSAATSQQQHDYCNGAATGQYYTFGVAFSASVDVHAFGFSLAGADIGVRITAAGYGTVDLVASAHFSIHFLFFSFSATAHFDIGTVQLPRPIYLAGDAGTNTAYGNSGWHGTVSNPQQIYVNMGTRAESRTGYFQGRGLAEGQPNESFTIDHVSGVAGNEKIMITAFGHSQTFAGVKVIHASGGPGNDTIVVDQGVLSPVLMDGGTGSDTLIYGGSGGATITGGPSTDPGADVIIINPDAGGTIVVNAGGGNAYIVDNSHAPGVTINGGAGNDSITGGYGAGDVLNGGGGNDVITSRGPSDHIDGGAGNDTIILNMPSSGSFPTVYGGGGSDSLAITATSSADTLNLSKSGADVVVADTAGPAAGGSFTASGIESLSLALGGGADTLTVGDLQDTTVTALTINVGTGDNAGDAVTIYGGSGADTFTLSGNDPSDGRPDRPHRRGRRLAPADLRPGHAAQQRRHAHRQRRRRQRHDRREPARQPVHLLGAEHQPRRPRRAHDRGRQPATTA